MANIIDEKIKIGRRAANEVLRLCRMREIDISDFCKEIDTNYATINFWMHGSAPSAEKLAALMRAGADLEYILTGGY